MKTTRLTLSNDTEPFKTPILLPGQHDIIKRLVAQKHVSDLHAGSQTLINNLREVYWIIGIRRLAKKVVRVVSYVNVTLRGHVMYLLLHCL